MHRITWAEVPVHVRVAIEAEVGAAVVRAETVEGGFSPSLAATLHLDDGRRVFAKAVSPAQNPDSPAILRHELDLFAALPVDVGIPTLLATIDDGEWIAGVFEHVDGRLPTIPWDPDELTRALDALAHLNAIEAPELLPLAPDHLAPLFAGWASVQRDGLVPAGWAAHADRLVELECASLDAVAGDRLVHNDVRADNMLVTPSGDIVFVDWAYACRGAPWLDLILWLPALQLEGGPTPDEVLVTLAPDRRPADDDLVAVVAGLAGYFVDRGRLPDPPGLPTVRAFQRAQGELALAWLARLLDLVPSPP